MVDEKLDDQVWVTVVATGYSGAQAPGDRAPADRGAGGRAARRAPQRARRRRARRAAQGSALPSWTCPSSFLADELPPHDGGMVAAGHPLTAEAGARVLREGGNAVDAAIAAMLVSWVAEPLLTGPGAGGYMLVAGAGRAADAAGLLRRRARHAARR